MIALCPEHHREADAGSWSPTELRAMKKRAPDRDAVLGSFPSWSKGSVVLRIAGCYFEGTKVPVAVGGNCVAEAADGLAVAAPLWVAVGDPTEAAVGAATGGLAGALVGLAEDAERNRRDEMLTGLLTHLVRAADWQGPAGVSGIDWDHLRGIMDEHRRIAPYTLGDFYPLTPYSLSPDCWMALQFDRPDLGSGIVEAFRRPESTSEHTRLKLRGLDPEAAYRVRDLDAQSEETLTGRDLMDTGLLVQMGKQPQAALIVYQRVG